MKVFISWSGPQAQQVAVALRDWLKAIVQSADPWASPTDILAGDRWSTEIGVQLEAANFGIICVTPKNQEAPWLNFEAGALSKNLGTARVVPYLHGLTIENMHGGPLKQFHAKEATRQGTWELILSLNNAIPSPLPEHILLNLFESMWPSLEARLAAIEMTPEDAALAQRSTEDKVDEILDRLRSQESRLERIPAIYRDLGFLIDSTNSAGAAIPPENIMPRVVRMMNMQMRAFIKPAKIHVDEEAGLITLTYDEKTTFHFRNMQRYEQELREVVRRVTSGRFGLQIHGPTMRPAGAALKPPTDDLPFGDDDEELEF